MVSSSIPTVLAVGRIARALDPVVQDGAVGVLEVVRVGAGVHLPVRDEVLDVLGAGDRAQLDLASVLVQGDPLVGRGRVSEDIGLGVGVGVGSRWKSNQLCILCTFRFEDVSYQHRHLERGCCPAGRRRPGCWGQTLWRYVCCLGVGMWFGFRVWYFLTVSEIAAV